MGGMRMDQKKLTEEEILRRKIHLEECIKTMFNEFVEW